MPKLWEKTGDAKNNSDLVEVDPSKLIISRPTIIFFPGQMTTETREELVSKDLNEIRQLFSDMAEPPQVYLWSYPDKNVPQKKMSLSSLFRFAVHDLTLHLLPPPPINELSALFRVAVYTASFQRSSFSVAKRQAKKLIMPLVTNAEGTPLPFDEAQKNLRNLTFMGYSIGGFAVQELYNASWELMRKAGYKRKDTRRLLQEIVLLNLGGFAEPRKEKNRYTSISLVHNDDRILRTRERLLHPLRRIFSHFSRRLKIRQLSDSSILVSATATGKWQDRRKQPQNDIIENVQLPRWRRKAFNHFFADYVNTDDNSNQFSRIAQYALMNAVNRKTTPKPVDLLKAPATLEKTPEVDRYERKIAQAAQKR